MMNDYGEVGGMRIWRMNRGIRRKPVQVPFCPLKFLHNPTWDQTRAAAPKNLSYVKAQIIQGRRICTQIYLEKINEQKTECVINAVVLCHTVI